MTYIEEMQRNFMIELRKDVEKQIADILSDKKEVNPDYIAEHVWDSLEVEAAFKMMMDPIVEEVKRETEYELLEAKIMKQEQEMMKVCR